MWDLVNGEVLGVNGGLQLGLEGSANAAELVPLNTAEEGVVFDLLGAERATETVFSVADQTKLVSIELAHGQGRGDGLPSDKVLSFGTNLLIGREVQVSGPIDNLPVSVMGLLGTEWRPADQTLKHDGTNTPPIATVVIALTGEDFRGNVIRSSDSGVGKLTTRFAPSVDLIAVADSQLDLVDGD